MKIGPPQPRPQPEPYNGDYMYSDSLPVYYASQNAPDVLQISDGGDHGEASEDLNVHVTELSFCRPSNEPINLSYGIWEDTCLAHLKLLHAIQSMKEEIGYTDGLWNLWDSRGKWALNDLRVDADWATIRMLERADSATVTKAGHSRLREKRWALFVARAVDRYEAWWHSLAETEMLTEQDMATPDNPKYKRFPNRHKMRWKEKMLPPLGKFLMQSLVVEYADVC